MNPLPLETASPADPPVRSLGPELRVLGSFFLRQMYLFWSNRTNAFFNLADILVFSLVFGLAGNFISDIANEKLADLLQGCRDYTTFLVIGFLVQMMVWSARGNVTWLVRSREFPNLFTTPCSLPTIILGANMWKYFWIILELSFFMAVTAGLFGVRYYFGAGFLVVVLAGILMMTAFDLIAAGYRIITKSESDPLNWTIAISGMLLSGSIIPVAALPGWLQPICKVHPQYYVNTLARYTLGQGRNLAEVWTELGLFLLVGMALLGLSYSFFRYGFRRARIDGTLGYE